MTQNTLYQEHGVTLQQPTVDMTVKPLSIEPLMNVFKDKYTKTAQANLELSTAILLRDGMNEAYNNNPTSVEGFLKDYQAGVQGVLKALPKEQADLLQQQLVNKTSPFVKRIQGNIDAIARNKLAEEDNKLIANTHALADQIKGVDSPELWKQLFYNYGNNNEKALEDNIASLNDLNKQLAHIADTRTSDGKTILNDKELKALSNRDADAMTGLKYNFAQLSLPAKKEFMTKFRDVEGITKRFGIDVTTHGNMMQWMKSDYDFNEKLLKEGINTRATQMAMEQLSQGVYDIQALRENNQWSDLPSGQKERLKKISKLLSSSDTEERETAIQSIGQVNDEALFLHSYLTFANDLINNNSADKALESMEEQLTTLKYSGHLNDNTAAQIGSAGLLLHQDKFLQGIINGDEAFLGEITQPKQATQVKAPLGVTVDVPHISFDKKEAAEITKARAIKDISNTWKDLAYQQARTLYLNAIGDYQKHQDKMKLLSDIQDIKKRTSATKAGGIVRPEISLQWKGGEQFQHFGVTYVFKGFDEANGNMLVERIK